MSPSSERHFNRRGVLAVAGALGISAVLGRGAAADLPAMEAWRQEILAGRTPAEGRIVLDLPEIAENGNTVPLVVEVESPMTEDDYVKAVHIMTERNPDPEVATFRFSPRSGRAAVSTRIRLAESGRVHAVAEMSDGTVYAVSRQIEVTIGGCGG